MQEHEQVVYLMENSCNTMLLIEEVINAIYIYICKKNKKREKPQTA